MLRTGWGGVPPPPNPFAGLSATKGLSLLTPSLKGDEEVETENDVTSPKNMKLTNKDKGSLVDWKVIGKNPSIKFLFDKQMFFF